MNMAWEIRLGNFFILLSVNSYMNEPEEKWARIFLWRLRVETMCPNNLDGMTYSEVCAKAWALRDALEKIDQFKYTKEENPVIYNKLTNQLTHLLKWINNQLS